MFEYGGFGSGEGKINQRKKSFMEKLKELQKIAEYTGLRNVASDIDRLTSRLSQNNTNIVVPLVGEFSSGKTTLINELTDSKVLETATKPTTATIYEMYFSQPTSKAIAVSKDGSEKNLEIENLKNEELKDNPLILVYDTNKRISSDVILVDTPGLESNDKSHKEALLGFLPKADAIFLVVDVNKQFTTVNEEFLKSARLSNRSVFVVLTFCDMVSSSQVQNTIELIHSSQKISKNDIVAISAAKGDVESFLQLVDRIHKQKEVYIAQASNDRVRIIAKRLSENIDERLSVAFDSKALKEKISKLDIENRRLENDVESLLYDIRSDIQLRKSDCIRKYEDSVFSKLDAMINEGGIDKEEASAHINGTGTLLLNDFGCGIAQILREYSEHKLGENLKADLSDVDTLKYAIESVVCDLDLEQSGHEYDSIISGGLKVLGKALDTEMPGASMIGDAIAAFVPTITEESMAKPQRRRLLHAFLDDKILPSFKSQMETISGQIESEIKSSLQRICSADIQERKQQLESLEADLEEQQLEYKKKVNQLKEYKEFVQGVLI